MHRVTREKAMLTLKWLHYKTLSEGTDNQRDLPHAQPCHPFLFLLRFTRCLDTLQAIDAHPMASSDTQTHRGKEREHCMEGVIPNKCHSKAGKIRASLTPRLSTLMRHKRDHAGGCLSECGLPMGAYSPRAEEALCGNQQRIRKGSIT